MNNYNSQKTNLQSLVDIKILILTNKGNEFINNKLNLPDDDSF